MTPSWPTRPRSDPQEWAGRGGFWLQLQARADHVAFARTVVAAFAARLPFTLDELEDVKLAVSEIVANVAVHAYGDASGPMWIGARVQDGTLEVVVEDVGRGIADLQQARRPGFSSLGGQHLGIGISVAETYTDALEMDSAPGEGTRVYLRKRPAGPPAT